MKRASFILLAALLMLPTCLSADTVNAGRYKEFADKKAAVDAEIAAEIARMETEYTTSAAPFVQQETDARTQLELAEKLHQDMTRAGFENKIVNMVLGAIKSKVSIPFFYLTVILGVLYLLFMKRALFNRFRILIAVLFGVLVVFYSFDLFAQDTLSHQVIDGKITTVNRLLGAGDVDKAIVAIEETTTPYIEMTLPDVTSTWLIPVETFRKGSFLEAYTLGCLYYETKNMPRTSALFSGAIANLKPGRPELPQVLNILQYFEEAKDPANAYTTLMAASAISAEQGLLLAHIDAAGLPADQAQIALDTILKRMKTAVDYLKAAVYLAEHGKTADASAMYGRAVATARDSAGFLGLAEYAYNNNIQAEAVVAMEKAFRSAHTTEAFIGYTRLAKKHDIANAQEAWDKAVAAARTVKDFVLVARYLNEQGSAAQAVFYLKQSVDKQGSVQDLLDVLNLAAEMNDSGLVAQMVDSVLGRTKKFVDLMRISEVCGKVAVEKLPEVFAATAASATKTAQFKALVNFVAGAADKSLINAVVEHARLRLLYVRDLQNLRRELMARDFKSVLGPINQAIVAKTRNRNELMALFKMFESEEFPKDAEAALARMVQVSGSVSVADNVLKLALEREYFGAAFDACIFLYPRNRGTTVPDPKLIQESSMVPNGPDVEYGVYCAIIGYRAGRAAEALAVVEAGVIEYLDAYINANISDPEAVLTGPINTYFYLRLLWEMSGTTNLITKYDSVYAAVEAKYLEEYKAERATAISDKQLEIESRRIALNESIESIQAQIQEVNAKIEQIRQENRKQFFKKFASAARIGATVLLFLIAIVIAVIAGLAFSRKLTRFRISGFTFKFFETFGFELMFTIILIPVGLLMLIGSQLSEMLLHIQQDMEPDGLAERLDGTDKPD